ncbi:hypothetical protein PHYPSEUDO_002374 [Phytophthora pseudosyringae]|uniref:ABC-2 type transporter transmembrane domain-containing protein n=1 Tax=Phytophthora pseudosyringae TaxID=221518 RepID=A0A8T1VU01_9STRA|nr:hypothetical protein PHYPSEUDO_002374 [Phytophthora pseudosyringae]
MQDAAAPAGNRAAVVRHSASSCAVTRRAASATRVRRERANNVLSIVSYVCVNFLVTLPDIFLIAVMLTVSVVLLAGLNAFEYFLLNLFLLLVVSESMMRVTGCAVPHYIGRIALGAGVFGMFILCEGGMVPHDSTWRCRIPE